MEPARDQRTGNGAEPNFAFREPGDILSEVEKSPLESASFREARSIDSAKLDLESTAGSGELRGPDETPVSDTQKNSKFLQLISSGLEAVTSSYKASRAALKLMWQHSPRATAIRIASEISTAGQFVLGGWLFGQALNAIVEGAAPGSPQLLLPAAGLTALYWFRSTIASLAENHRVKQNQSLELNIQHMLGDTLENRFEDSSSPALADEITKVRENTWRIAHVGPVSVLQGIGLVSSVAFSAAGLWKAPLPVVGLACAASLIPICSNLIVASRVRRDEDLISEPRRKSWYQGWFRNQPEVARELVLLDASQDIKQQFEENVRKVYEKEIGRANTTLNYALFANPVSAICAASSLLILSSAYRNGQLASIGDVSFIFAAAIPLLSNSLAQASKIVGDLLAAEPFFSGLENLSSGKAEQQISGASNQIDWSKWSSSGPPISVQGLGYSYDLLAKDAKKESDPELANFVLRNVSFEIPAGQFVAVVGDIGAGKSTLFQTISRLRNPSEGRVLVAEKDTAYLSRHDWFAHIGYCFQDPGPFASLTILESLTLGLRHKDAGFIERVAKATGLHGILFETYTQDGQEKRRFPLGFDTPIGSEFKDGKTLSGGERQLLAITRALIRRPRVLFLDEPTANLDPERSMQIMQLLKNLDSLLGFKPTVMMVTHDYRRAREADRIFVVDKQVKGIAEEGTHLELLKLEGIYARKWRSS